MINRKAQQEMVGFILIIVLVVVAAVIFLVISANKPAKENTSVEIQNLVSSMMDYTTGCEITNSLPYSDLKHLISNCRNNEMCLNLGKSACDYLNESAISIMDDVMKSESTVSAYQLEIYYKESSNSSNTESIIPKITSGNCTGVVQSGFQRIPADNGAIFLKISFCYEN